MLSVSERSSKSQSLRDVVVLLAKLCGEDGRKHEIELGARSAEWLKRGVNDKTSILIDVQFMETEGS